MSHSSGQPLSRLIEWCGIMTRMSCRRSAVAMLTACLIVVSGLPAGPFRPVVAVAATSAACPANHGVSARVVAVEEGLALRLDDGRRVLPAAIAPPEAIRDDPYFEAHSRQALAALLVGTSILAPPPNAAAPDRWGDVAGAVFATAPTGAEPGDVATMIVAAGWARVEPSTTAPVCIAPLLQAEAAAREARRGLWADPAFAVLAADAPASFAGRFGTLQIVEGRVASLGESGPRLYLNFGPRRGADFAAVVDKTRIKAFDTAGLPLRGLLGRRLRVRGLLDDVPGPHIEIGGPAWVEWIEGT